jgi:CRISPR/Cas system-associated protein endoribonuclease Cas2
MELGKISDTITVIIKVAIVLAIVGVGWKVYDKIDDYFDNKKEVAALKLEQDRQYKEYAANLARAKTEIVGSLKDELSEITKKNSQAMNAMLAEIKKNDEKINNVGSIVGKLSNEVVELKVASSKTYEGTKPGDLNAYEFKKIYYTTKDESGKEMKVPIAWAMYFPNRPENERWKDDVYPIEFHTQVIQSEQQDGQTNSYVQLWLENNKDKESKGVEYPLPVEQAEFKQLKITEKQFFWWSPHFSLNVDAGYSSGLNSIVAGGISFSFSGYGRTKNDLDYRFFDFGVSTNGNDTYAKFTPFAWNLGNVIPVIHNSFLGPYIGMTTDSKYVVGIGLSIPF